MTYSYSGNPGAVREDGTPASDKNQEYDYVLRYIDEAIDYRTKKMSATARAIEAYKGYPSTNGYKKACEAYASLFDNEDGTKASGIRERCKGIKARKNMIIQRAIDSMVAQAQGGVGQYECAPYDKNFEKSPELIDALDEVAMDFYQKNRIDSVLSSMLEWAGLSGACYSYLGYDNKRELNSGRITMDVIPDTEMLIDPVCSKRNRERYIGHQTKGSWVDLKNKLKKNPKTDEYMLQSINMVDTYLHEVEWWINEYNGDFSAMMPAISGATDHWVGNPFGYWYMENLPRHIDSFYKASALAWKKRNTKYIRRAGTQYDLPEDGKYHADEIEICYLYDLENHIRFTVVNRRFIVEASRDYLQAEMPYTYFEIDEYSGNAIDMSGKKKISLDHPYIPLCYKKSLWETYPYSPVIHCLDLFDDLCALETMVYHTISIMTPITFTGNPKDIEKLGAIAGVSGEAIKGFIANSVTVLNKAVDLTPAMSEISRLENAIMNILHGVDPKEQAQMIGNRATAAEAMQAASLVSQGLNSLIANVETWASDLALKMFKLTVIYEPEDFVYDLNAGGKHLTLTRKDLAGDFGVRAVLKSKIKAEQQAQAANTVQWFVPLMNSDAIVNKEAFAQTIIPTLAQGFTRKAIMSWFTPSEEQKAAQEAAIELQKEQAKAIQEQNKKLDFSYIDPTSGGKYGSADIAKALSSRGYDPAALDEANMKAKSSPVGGTSRPTNTSRSLNYGNVSQLPEGDIAQAVTPNGLPQASIPASAVSYSSLAGLSEEMEGGSGENANSATLEALLSPTSGGLYANNGLTGANSPRTQGVA